MKTQFLFVYGWLKRKYHQQLPFEMPRSFVDEAYTYGEMYKVAEYPGVYLKGSRKIFGEIYQVNASQDWTKMDAFEHASPHIKQDPDYRRILTTCYIGNKQVQCWIYEYLKKVNPLDLIEGGVF